MSVEVFVNRDEELRYLSNLVMTKSKVLLLGLRGYGKSSLLRKLLELLLSRGIVGVFIDCLRIYNGGDLLLEFRNYLNKMNVSAGDVFRELELLAKTVNPRSALDSLFEFAKKLNIGVLIFDEISTLIQRFSVFKPYRRLGGARAVGEHLKSLLDSFDGAVIFSDTSISALHELFREYTSPLFREFTAEIFLEPLSIEDTIEYARILLKRKGVELDNESLNLIAQFSGGVPQYVRIIVDLINESMDREALEDMLEYNIKFGFLNTYFRALLDKFSPAEQETLYVISRGFTRFSEIEDKVTNAPATLESLQRKGMVIKIEKGKKRTHYLLRDKLFAYWLATREFPRLKRLADERARLLYIGLEALVREIFFTLQQEVKIVDELGNELIIEPTTDVKRYEGALGEVDMIAITKSKKTYVAEIYGGLKCPKRKLDELIKAMVIAEKLGHKEIIGLLITYFPPPQELTKHAEEIRKQGIELYILTKKQLKDISKYSAIRL